MVASETMSGEFLKVLVVDQGIPSNFLVHLSQFSRWARRLEMSLGTSSYIDAAAASFIVALWADDLRYGQRILPSCSVAVFISHKIEINSNRAPGLGSPFGSSVGLACLASVGPLPRGSACTALFLQEGPTFLHLPLCEELLFDYLLRFSCTLTLFGEFAVLR